MVLLDRRNIGFAMIVVGLLAGLLGIWSLYGSVQRWLMIAHLEEAQLAAFEGDQNARRRAGRAAAKWQLHPSNLLMQVDLAEEDGQRVIDRALALAEYRDREAVETTRALADALAGTEPAGSLRIDSADRALLEQLARLRAGQLQQLPELPSTEGATIAVLVHTLEERLHHAWIAGDVQNLQADIGRLLTIAPRHPAHRPLNLMHHTLSSIHNDRDLARGLRGMRGTKKYHWVRISHDLVEHDPSIIENDEMSLAAALRKRRQWVAEQIRKSKRTPREKAWYALRSEPEAADSDELFDKAVASKTPVAVSRALNAALANDRFEQIEDLLPLVPDAHREAVRLVLARRSADLRSLQEAGGDSADWIPRLVGPYRRPLHFNFHLLNQFGLLPDKPVQITIDGRTVPTADVLRHGPAISLRLPSAARGRLTVTVSMDQVQLFAGEVQQ